MHTAKEVLIEMRELLSDPARWTKGAGSRDAAGTATNSSGLDATCFCLWGAEAHVLSKHGLLGSRRVEAEVDAIMMKVVAEVSPGTHVATYNDHADRTHAEIMAYLDRCVEAA